MTVQAIDSVGAARRGGTAYGFTLIEMLAVITILSILIAIAYPAYGEHVRRSRRVEAIAALNELMLRQERHYSHNNSYFIFSRGANPQQYKWFSAATPAASSHEISARQCDDETLTACVRMEAVPGTDGVDSGFADPACGTLTLDSRGRRSPSDANCWR